jgi:hypothetical protein
MHGRNAVAGRIESTVHYAIVNRHCSLQDCSCAEDAKQLYRSGTCTARSPGCFAGTLSKEPQVFYPAFNLRRIPRNFLRRANQT